MKDAHIEAAFQVLKLRLRIDRDALDREIVEQPTLYQDAHEQGVFARSRAVQAADELKVVEAKLYQQLAEKRSLDGESTTVAALNGLVQKHSKRHEAFLLHLKAVEWQNRWDGLTESFRQRGYMIRELAQLMVMGLVATREVKGPGVRGVQERELEKARDQMTERRRRRMEEEKR